MLIEYYKKSVYGEDRLYVVQPGQAAIISELTGKKTVTDRDLRAFRALGIGTLEVLQPKKRNQ